MFGIQFFKADSSTFVIKTVNGRVKKRGKGLSFFYNSSASSIATVPVNAQDAPFIFNLQTKDFQSVKVQGQLTYRVEAPEKTAELLNFNLKNNGQSYVSDDPMKLSDRVVRAVQSIVQNVIQSTALPESLLLSQALVTLLRKKLAEEPSLSTLGIKILDISVNAITPSPETSRALEAEAREAILKTADDAIYARRKSSVEQELTIKEAELETELIVQQKEQGIVESRLENERAILRGTTETERERLQGEIESENQRKDLVRLNVENGKLEADSEAYAISSRMNAIKALPVENLKAMAMANMNPEQLMALAFESLAQNAGKIGELNISPDMFGQMMKKARIS